MGRVDPDEALGRVEPEPKVVCQAELGPAVSSKSLTTMTSSSSSCLLYKAIIFNIHDCIIIININKNYYVGATCPSPDLTF